MTKASILLGLGLAIAACAHGRPGGAPSTGARIERCTPGSQLYGPCYGPSADHVDERDRDLADRALAAALDVLFSWNGDDVSGLCPFETAMTARDNLVVDEKACEASSCRRARPRIFSSINAAHDALPKETPIVRLHVTSGMLGNAHGVHIYCDLEAAKTTWGTMRIMFAHEREGKIIFLHTTLGDSAS